MKLLFMSLQNVHGFKNSLTGTLCEKCAITSLLYIPQHLNCVATLRCKI